jgi:hypothetical protein
LSYAWAYFGVVFLKSRLYRICAFEFLDFLFKFLVIGSAGTGKSCLLHQFIEGKCKMECIFCEEFSIDGIIIRNTFTSFIGHNSYKCMLLDGHLRGYSALYYFLCYSNFQNSFQGRGRVCANVHFWMAWNFWQHYLFLA